MAELNILHYLSWDANAFTALDFLRTALQLVPALWSAAETHELLK